MFLDNNLNFILNKIHARRDFTDEYVASSTQHNYFKQISNRKSDGTLRWIYEPKTDEHASLYKAIYEGLKEYQPQLHESVHGFRSGHSNVTNASQHLSANHLFNIDIENFYSHINDIDVLAVLLDLGANTEVATYLSKLCTVDGVLPQGFNTSPDIANHYLSKLDNALSDYATEREIVYTRYVDDMSFSSKNQIEASEICDIVESFGLPLAQTKRKYQKRGANQYVTGLTIFDSEHPRIGKKYKRRIRLELHIIHKVGIEPFIIKLHELPEQPKTEVSAKEWKDNLNELTDKKLSQLKGRIDYINGVEPLVAQKMYPVYDNIIIERKQNN